MASEKLNISEYDIISAETKSSMVKNERIIGYCRVSSNCQDIQRQIRNIKAAYPTAVIVEEVFSGRKISRPKWDKVMSLVKNGLVDTIVFDSVSRMSRSKEEGSRLYFALYRANVRLVFLREPCINTDEYRKAMDKQIDISLKIDDKATTELMNGIFDSLNRYFVELASKQVELCYEQAEKEVEDLRQRTREGLLSARLRGKQLGRKKGTKVETRKAIKCKRIIRKKFTAFGGDLNAADTIRLCGNIARSTFYRYVNELLEDDALKGKAKV